jgi:O-acetyl-ADP-ribose deacetylase (regulator of RNase III)
VIELFQGDITSVKADAIVNAANAALAGGGGVDGAIHRAGGPSIMEECRRIGGCATGSAVITGAGNLQARYVIHAVAPIYRGTARDAQLLASAYEQSLALAAKHEVQSIAFPSLGTGAYGYPIDQASEIAIATIARHLRGRTSLREVLMVLFSLRDFQMYESALSKFGGR